MTAQEAWKNFLEGYKDQDIFVRALLEAAFMAGWEARETTLKRQLEKMAGNNNGVIYYSAIRF